MRNSRLLELAVLLILLISSIKQHSLAYSVTETTRVEIFEEYSYICSRDSGRGYTERARHKLIVNVFEAPSGSDNLTLTIETEEELIYTRPSWPQVKNSSTNGRITIETSLSTSYLFLEIGLNCSQSSMPDPFDIEMLPSDLNTFPVDADGHLEFTLALNASEFVERADLSIESPREAQNNIRSFSIDTSLNITDTGTYGGDLDLEISNIPPGNHTMQFRIRFAEVKGQIEHRLRVIRGGETYCQVRCFIGDEEIDCHKQINVFYQTPEKDFIRAGENWIYGYDDYNYYIINFTTIGEDLPLRIDRFSRETIDFIRIESEITDISVKETMIYDNPCYSLRFGLKNKSNVSMGVMIYEKVWFISSENMSLDQIPRRILDRYTDPNMIGYHNPSLIDKESPLVRKWCEEVIEEESNPYIAALALFENLSATLKYDDNLTGCRLTASEILRNRRGVCEHFAVAYATLCAAVRIPVRYVVGSVFRVEELWKKDHAWNEVFLPGYGWIPVDVTWDFFGELPGSHFLSTLWTYQNATLNVTKIQDPQIRWKNTQTLSDSLNFCEMKLTEVMALRSLALLVPQGLDEVIDRNHSTLQKMQTSAEYQCTHDVLVSTANILLSMDAIVPVAIFFAVIPPVLVLSVCLAVVFMKRKRIRWLLQKYSTSKPVALRLWAERIRDRLRRFVQRVRGEEQTTAVPEHVIERLDRAFDLILLLAGILTAAILQYAAALGNLSFTTFSIRFLFIPIVLLVLFWLWRQLTDNPTSLIFTRIFVWFCGLFTLFTEIWFFLVLIFVRQFVDSKLLAFPASIVLYIVAFFLDRRVEAFYGYRGRETVRINAAAYSLAIAFTILITILAYLPSP